MSKNPVVKSIEKLPPRIVVEETDKHCSGDCVVKLRVPCSSCCETVDIAPTSEEAAFIPLLIGRNDDNRYQRWGRRYMLQYMEILFRENTLEYEYNIRSKIQEELIQSDKIQQLLQLKEDLLDD